MLRRLHEDAERARGRITYAQMVKASGAIHSTIGGWLSEREEARTAPRTQSLSKYRALVTYLADKAGVRIDWRAWDQAIADAMAESRRNRGGRPRNGPRRARPGRFQYAPAAKGLLPPILLDREGDLDRLAELVRTRSGYLVLRGDPSSGKTALLATFAARYAADIDIDLVSYFVRRGQDSDNAQAFLSTMVAVLGQHVGRRRPTVDRATLVELWEEAARTSGLRGRKLLVVVDGLDEDAGARPGGQSIAGLLPKQTYPELVVLVAFRWNPPLPTDLDADHPLRDAEGVPGFRPSPHALVLRDIAAVDLDALIDEPRGWGQQVVGYLLVARGGLTSADLIELIGLDPTVSAPMPRVLKRMLHNVAGRGLGPEDLEPESFVLAHEQLYAAAEEALGPGVIDAVTLRLHTWADRYRAEGWPDTTPVYLLHHYQKLLSGSEDFDRYTAFALDHRRLLRLADMGRVDLALSSLDRFTGATAASAVRAAAAASRSLLRGEDRTVPREVLRALVLVGDADRARSLALSALDPASKAVRLIEVVRALLATGMPEAAERATDLAREAAVWAERSRYQDPVVSASTEMDTQAILPRAAVALAAAGSADEAVRVLKQIDFSRPENVASVAEAASLLADAQPEFAALLLDELEIEADYQAEADEGRPLLAVEIWAAVAAADAGRAEAVHRTMMEFVEQLSMASSGLSVVDCRALAASALARALPDKARELADSARREVLDFLESASQDVLGETMSRVVRALLDVGEAPGAMRALVAEAPEKVAARARELLDGPPDEDDLGEATAETTGVKETAALLRDMRRLSDLGDGPRLRQSLDRFTGQAVGRSAPEWLPFLTQALPGAVNDVWEKLLPLVDELSDTLLHVRVLTSAALAHADARRHDEARRYAEKVAGIAARMTRLQPPTVRGLVAQAFACVGDAERARAWAVPADGRRPFGRAGVPYRRAALAVEMGLEPAAVLSRVVENGPPGLGVGASGMGASGTELVRALCDHAAGLPTQAHVASLETEARARLHTEPLLATGLALLYAVLGDTERASVEAAGLPDPAARGRALAAVATYVAHVPVHLDVAADGDDWTLSVLGVLAHRMCPAVPLRATAAWDMARQALDTSSWYRALPVLSRTDPEAVRQVAAVLVRHSAVRRPGP
ncbi:hypothetical protein ACFVYD_06035 [Streptomyces sp. NPDC058301]|uniref:hypothetical protein n=1 Tax=Streptomyces sp. NPDC058301 TaxID=3346436 RepID=UPI0036E51B6E